LQALRETKKAHELTFSEGLEVLLQGEEDERSNNRRERLLKNAKFRYHATLEQLIYNSSRGLDRGLISSLATCDFITRGETTLITGATGCGKSFIASALGHHACARGYSVAYYNMQKLAMITRMARLDGNVMKFFEKTARTSLLIIDDFGITNFDQQLQLDLMELIEDRHGKNATIISSQLPVDKWHEAIGDATIADSILDRLVHSSYRIELKGESLRKIR
jgi:DNA replication protein DnaC